MRIVTLAQARRTIMAPIKFAGLTHWQWQNWLWDKRMAYQRTFPAYWRAENEEYFIKHTSQKVKNYLLKVKDEE